MSKYVYEVSREIMKSDPSFYALIMAAMRKADTNNLDKLVSAWPEVWFELNARYNAPNGDLPND